MYPAEREVERLPLEELSDSVAVAHRLSEQHRVQPPALHGREPARDGDDGEPRPSDTASAPLPTTRFYVAIQVTGDVELLEWWPDTLGADLPPVDHGLGEWISPAPGTPFDAAEARRRHQALLAQDLWSVGRRSDAGPWALYPFVDLTEHELEELATNGRVLSTEVDESMRVIEPIVEAIAAQIRVSFDTDMPRHLQQLIEARRRHLQGRRRAVRSLTWPTGWKYDTPTLTALPATPASHIELDTQTSPASIPWSTPRSSPDTILSRNPRRAKQRTPPSTSPPWFVTPRFVTPRFVTPRFVTPRFVTSPWGSRPGWPMRPSPTCCARSACGPMPCTATPPPTCNWPKSASATC